MKNLYLIGNGFDIHHGINSSYAAYRGWLLDNDPGLYNTMKDYYLFDVHDGKGVLKLRKQNGGMILRKIWD